MTVSHFVPTPSDPERAGLSPHTLSCLRLHYPIPLERRIGVCNPLCKSIGNTKPLFTRIPPPVPPRALPAPPRATGTTPRRTSRASGWPALDATGRPPARAVGHGQDGWLVTGSLLGLLGGEARIMNTAGWARTSNSSSGSG